MCSSVLFLILSLSLFLYHEADERELETEVERVENGENLEFPPNGHSTRALELFIELLSAQRRERASSSITVELLRTTSAPIAAASRTRRTRGTKILERIQLILPLGRSLYQSANFPLGIALLLSLISPVSTCQLEASTSWERTTPRSSVVVKSL